MKHIFWDFENLGSLDAKLIDQDTSVWTLLLGPKCKVDGAIVEKVLANASRINLIRIAKSGSNAVDFALTYYLGRAVSLDPHGEFLIASNDAGFDPLVEHLATQNVKIRRMACAPAPAPAQPSLFEKAKAHLIKNAANRPKKHQSLVKQLKALAGPAATDTTIKTLTNRLIKAGLVSVEEGGGLKYHMPTSKE